MKFFSCFFIFLLSFPSALFAHSAMDRFWGEVPVDMLISGDVLVVKTLTVPEGVTLTIDKGTVVRFEGSKDGINRIVVSGRLIAVGTSERPIMFIPKSPGSGPWYGIEFRGGTGRLEHCVFEGAAKGIRDPAGKAAVKDVSFK